MKFCPGWCGTVDSAAACVLRGSQFDSRSVHMARLWIKVPAGGVGETTDQCFLHVDVSLPLFLPYFPSL